MTFKQMALTMWPSWVAGAIIVWAAAKSKYKSLLRIDKKAIRFWLGYLAFTCSARYLFFKFFGKMSLIPVDMKAITDIPWQACLFVFWEDATHILPLLILAHLAQQKKYLKLFYYASVFLIMLDFGMGHIYQSPMAGLMMMFYIPVVMRLARQYGVGTVMICHTLYDLASMATILLSMKGK